ncbi:hypothetical protein EJ05DRAFT_43126 [Pseudovirgaria hyperparasitica]|uniref:Saccharopine dehydrogenase NADP binding domain-containing protein n=1 Tax=Pseudovirgaria hyperparasitica TaxID=470096 RepID=A0A6A6WMW0_9PEZI|nr:uncharacterized protein EJ05DRAFT_43126 [Pseudovirgaria hyperparasitica]KAF2763565.1 hypothetical protein EJ05DRAFT_43126 [Pseudovirgaria hyperparasitica]
MVVDNRPYELVLYGASGYTGKLCAEHITMHLPTNLNWAVAGRSADKLQGVVKKLEELNRDRNPPSIEVTAHQKDDLHALVRKTRLVVTTVGPYSKMGEPMVEACASNGTHYLDCTGESPWFRQMIQRYHRLAQSTGAIIIPQCGIESVPADLLTYIVCNQIRSRFSSSTRNVTHVLYNAKASASGGTLSSILAVFETFSISYLIKSMHPFALCPTSPSSSNRNAPLHAQQSLYEKLLGVANIPGMGIMTDSPGASVDTAVVNRSWGLLSSLSPPSTSYGPNFFFKEWMRSTGLINAAIFHYAFMAAPLFLIMPPIRWLLRKFVFLSPGDGPDLDQAGRREFIEYRTIGEADPDASKKTSARLYYEGSMYAFTGILLAEAAMVLARPEEKSGQPCEARRLGGGLLTTACLGEEFVDRLKAAHGVVLEVQ